MTLMIASLIILAASATAALVMARAPRMALNTAMIGICIASSILLVAAGTVLFGASPTASHSVAWPMPLGTARLAVDGLSAWFLMVVGLLGASVSLYSIPYLSVHPQQKCAAYGALLSTLLAALILVVSAADAVLFLVGWEAVLLSAFFLVAFEHHRAEVRRGAWMYLVANHIGTALFVLPLFSILIATAGSTAFAAFGAPMAAARPWIPVVVFALGLVGFGTKAGFMPMHIWLPAAHPVAPTPVSALLSGVVVKIGIYAILRLLTWLPALPLACGYALLAIGVVSGVMGVLYALAQHDLKRLLAYHTVENIGIIALGMGVGMLGQSTGHLGIAVLGYAGALLHVANHALFKGLLFLSAGAVLHSTGTIDIERLGGLARRTPLNALMFLVGAVAICGLPPLNGFVSEWFIYGSLFAGATNGLGGSGAAPAIGLVSLALMGGLALACFAKVVGVVFLGEPRDSRLAVHPTPPLMKIAMTGLACACVFIGVLPGLWVPLTQRASSELVQALPSAVAPAIRDMLAPATTLTAMALIFVCFVVILTLIRRSRQAAATARDQAGAGVSLTWGCAFTVPTARMQYTASSFAASLIASFRAMLWPEKIQALPAGVFPLAARLETHTPDIAEHELFTPMFRAVARAFAMLRTVSWSGDSGGRATATDQRHGALHTLAYALVTALRRGSIQVRLAYIVLTLILLLLIESLTLSPRTSAHSRALPDVVATPVARGEP